MGTEPRKGLLEIVDGQFRTDVMWKGWGKHRRYMQYLKLALVTMVVGCASNIAAPQVASAGDYVLVDSLSGNGTWLSVVDGQLSINADQTYSWRIGTTSFSGAWEQQRVSTTDDHPYLMFYGTSTSSNWFVMSRSTYDAIVGAFPANATIVAGAGNFFSPNQYAFRKR